MSIHATGPAPAKSSTKFTLSFGLVNIPCAMYSGIDKDPNPRHLYSPAGNRIAQLPIDSVTLAMVAKDKIVKKATASDGTEVELTNDEIASVYERAGVTSGHIVKFVPLSAIEDGTYLATGYGQLRPAKDVRGKKRVDNPVAQKGFMLLLAAMAEEDVFALIRLVQREGSVPRYAAVLPDGRLSVLAFAEQVRAAYPMPDVDVTPAEVAMGRQLIRQVGVDTVALVDDVGDQLRAFVDAKAGGVVEQFTPVAEAAPVVDLMAQLQASLAAAA